MRQRHTRTGATLSLLIMTGCGQTIHLGDLDQASADAGIPKNWGEYAATLDVPLCPEGRTLVVTDTSVDLGSAARERSTPPTTEELDQISRDPGPTLSFFEALWIASREPDQVNVMFDPSVFPASSPETIRLHNDDALPQTLDSVCIDGRNRGVVLSWDPSSGTRIQSVWDLRQGSLQVGLSLVEIPDEQRVINSQIAGCRYQTMTRGGWFLELLGDPSPLVGPGNAFLGAKSLRVFGVGSIDGNFFGYDPVTETVVATPTGIDLNPSAPGMVPSPLVEITRNTFATAARSLFWRSLGSRIEAVLRENTFGADQNGRVLETSGTGVEAGLGAQVGPGNVLHGLDVGIYARERGAKITRNEFGEHVVAIQLDPSIGLVSPTITSVTSSEIRGTCAVDGLIEVFRLEAGESIQFIAQTSCAAGEWIAPAVLNSGSQVTATLTASDQTTSAFGVPATFSGAAP